MVLPRGQIPTGSERLYGEGEKSRDRGYSHLIDKWDRNAFDVIKAGDYVGVDTGEERLIQSVN
jgi:hypothetical protein